MNLFADRRWVRRFARGRGAVLLLVAAVLSGAAVRSVVANRNAVAFSDTFSNLLIAESIVKGRGFSSGGAEHPDLSRSVLLPMTIAAVTPLVGTAERGAWLIVVAAGALIVVPLFFLARSALGPRAAIAALPLGALSCIVGASATLLATSLFVLLAVTAAALVWQAARRSSRVIWVAAGVATGLTTLTRPEALALPPIFVAWLMFDRARVPARDGYGIRRRLGAAGLFVASVLVVYGPYAVWASVKLGRISFSPGIEYLQAMRDVSDHLGLREVDNPVPWADRARFMLTADHRDLYLESYLKTGTFAAPDRDIATVLPSGPGGVEADRWRGVVRRRFNIVSANLRLAPRKAFWGHFVTPVVTALSLIGFVAAMTSSRGRRVASFLVLVLFASLAPLLSHVEARFLYLPYAVGLVVASAGWGVLARLLVAKTSRLRASAWMRVTVHGVLVAGIAWSGVAHEARDPLAASRSALLRQVATTLGSQLPPGAMLAVQPNLPYWCGHAYRPIPVATATGILDYARAQGATALVLEGDRDLADRPDLAFLVSGDRPPAFRLVRSVPHPNGGSLLVFELGTGNAVSPYATRPGDDASGHKHRSGITTL